MVNRLCGTDAFHIWNIDEVPDVDIARLLKAYEAKADVAGLED
jgi:hypothetical protein